MAGEKEEQAAGGEETLNVDETVNDLAQSLNLLEEGDEQQEAAPPKEEQAAAPEGTSAEMPTSGEAPAAGTTEPPAAAAAPSEQVPDTWRKEAKEKWATVDPVVRAEIAKREADISRFVAEAQPSFQIAQGLHKIVEPYLPLMQQYNLDPLQHIGALLGAHTTLLFGRPEQKAHMFRTLAKQAGIDIAALADPNSLAQADTQQLEYVRGLEERLARMEQGMTGVTSSLHEGRVAELEQGIKAFAEDANHPWFWELAESGEIKALIDAGAARTLHDAYELAVYRNPVTRAKQLELEGRRKAEADARQASERAAAARKATRANVKSRGSGRAPQAEESIDDTLRDTLADINSRT